MIRVAHAANTPQLGEIYASEICAGGDKPANRG